MRILAISGSLRKGSSNTALLIAVKALALKSVKIEIYPSLGDLPYFNPDLDREGIVPPTVVQNFRQEIAASDALLISTPEYAHGIPGVLKNALDWLVSDLKFPGKPVGVILGSSSDSNFARTAIIEVLQIMSAKVIPEAIVSIKGSRVRFDPAGTLDPQTSLEVMRVIKALVEAP